MDFDPVLVVAVLGLVNFIKSFGLEGRTLTIVSALVGVVLYVLQQVLPADVTRIVLGGILVGLGASGIYDLGQIVGAQRKSA
jgi:hypothetical protein